MKCFKFRGNDTELKSLTKALRGMRLNEEMIRLEKKWKKK